MQYHSHLAVIKMQLGPTQFDVLHSEMYRLGRHTLTAYTLWGLLGWAGVHQQYLGRRWKGALYLFCVLVAAAAAVQHLWAPFALEEPYITATRAVGFVAGLLFLFGMVVDMFSLHRQVDLCNERIEDHIIMALVNRADEFRPPVDRPVRAAAAAGVRTGPRPLYFE
ncbi:MAG: TM2 domain-containing protein [Nitrospiraceae bacterium]